MIVSKQGIDTKTLASQTLTTFEHSQYRVTVRKTDITVTAIYHPPYSPANNITITAFLDEFTKG